MTDEETPLAVADGGPLDGQVLGPAAADRYEVRMADGSSHLHVRSKHDVEQGRLFDDAGRR